MFRLRQGDQYSFANQLLVALAINGYYLTRSSKMLDFGCGAGELVREFRAKGFSARGFDIYNDMKLCSGADPAWFDFLPCSGGDSADYRQAWDEFQLPYEDDAFDVIVSSTVMEHVQNHAAVMAELARVTRPGGCGLHLYPAKWTPIEPHIFVPFGGGIQHRWWFLLWAALGVRNSYQHGFSIRETAAHNLHYASNGLNYPDPGAMFDLCQKYFKSVRYAPHSFYYNGRLTGLYYTPAGVRYANTFGGSVLLTEK